MMFLSSAAQRLHFRILSSASEHGPFDASSVINLCSRYKV